MVNIRVANPTYVAESFLEALELLYFLNNVLQILRALSILVVSTKEYDISQRMTCARFQRYPKSRQRESLGSKSKL